MVKKVVVPARSSVVKLEFLSVNLNRLPIQVLATAELRRSRRPGCAVVWTSIRSVEASPEMGKLASINT